MSKKTGRVKKEKLLYVVRVNTGKHWLVYADDDKKAVKLAVNGENTYGSRDANNGEIVHKTNKSRSLHALPYGMSRLPNP
jgi:hypothetical protein